MSRLLMFTSESWEKEVLQAGLPVFVDFQAPWYRRPEQNDPLEKLAQELGESAHVGTLDVSLLTGLGEAFRLFDLPILCLFYRGKLMKSFQGHARVLIVETIRQTLVPNQIQISLANRIQTIEKTLFRS